VILRRDGAALTRPERLVSNSVQQRERGGGKNGEEVARQFCGRTRDCRGRPRYFFRRLVQPGYLDPAAARVTRSEERGLHASSPPMRQPRLSHDPSPKSGSGRRSSARACRRCVRRRRRRAGIERTSCRRLGAAPRMAREQREVCTRRTAPSWRPVGRGRSGLDDFVLSQRREKGKALSMQGFF
jgi:hypothetical protein